MSQFIPHVAVFVLALGASASVAAEAPKQMFCDQGLSGPLVDKLWGDRYSRDPTKLAAAWILELERLSSAISSLSPREEQWLDDELESESVERVKRASSSREFALRYAKQNAQALVVLMRRLNEMQDRTTHTRDWLWVVHMLIDSDSSYFLAELNTAGLVKLEAIPIDWTTRTGMGFSLQDAIRLGRIRLAKHVLACTLPSVLAFEMTPIDQ